MNAEEVWFWWGLAIIAGMMGLIGMAWLMGSLARTAIEKRLLEEELRLVKFERDQLRYIMNGIPPLPKPSPTNDEEVRV